MIDLITSLNSKIDARLQATGMLYWGLADQVRKGDQVHPVEISKNKQISIDDKWEGIVFHRLLSSQTVDSEDDTFGSNIAKRTSVRIRTVLATKKKKGEQFRFDFAEAIPYKMEVDGYRRIDVAESLTMIEDQSGIYTQEFGNNNYEKHIQEWNINALEYDISFVACKDFAEC